MKTAAPIAAQVYAATPRRCEFSTTDSELAAIATAASAGERARLLTLAITLAGCASTRPASRSFDRQEIRAAAQDIVAALESLDPMAWVEHHTEAAVLLEPGESESRTPWPRRWPEHWRCAICGVSAHSPER